MEFGATHTAASMEEAIPLVTDLSWGVMANSVILTPGVLSGDLIQPAMTLASKGGTVVATAVAPWTQEDVKLSLFEMTPSNKQLLGTVFGSGSPRRDIPDLLTLYQNGNSSSTSSITKKYKLDEINEGYQDMRDGKNIRGVIDFG